MPFFRNNHGAVAAALGGWQLNGIWSFQTGAHWSPFNSARSQLQEDRVGACSASSFDSANCVNVGGDYNLDGEANDRPNALVNHIKTSHRQWAQGFNLPTNFFSAPCLGCAGNLGRNTFVGPRYWEADASLFKNIELAEGVRLQIRVEGFNILNHTNFLLGTNDINSPAFGIAAGTQPPRNLQFGLKLSY
jgi:hypothetical protein